MSDGVWDDDSENAEQKIVASDGASGDKLGLAADIGVGYAVMGAEEASSDAGAGYVVVKSGDIWGVNGKANAKLTMASQGGTDYLGHDVSITGDGSVIALGAWKDEGFKGSVLVYNRPGGGWATTTESVKVQASDIDSNDNFGFSVDLEKSDGSKLLVGASGLEQNNNGDAYLFSTTNSVNWVEDQIIVPTAVTAADKAGTGVAIDGAYLAFSAPEDDDPNNSGVVYAYYDDEIVSPVPEFGAIVYVLVVISGVWVVLRVNEQQAVAAP